MLLKFEKSIQRSNVGCFLPSSIYNLEEQLLTQILYVYPKTKNHSISRHTDPTCAYTSVTPDPFNHSGLRGYILIQANAFPSIDSDEIPPLLRPFYRITEKSSVCYLSPAATLMESQDRILHWRLGSTLIRKLSSSIDEVCQREKITGCIHTWSIPVVIAFPKQFLLIGNRNSVLDSNFLFELCFGWL